MLFFAAVLCCLALVASEPARSTFPGVGRLQFNNAFYNWTDAVRACSDFGAYLAVAQSQSEAAELQRVMALNGAEETHYGLHDIFNEGRYVTLLDQPLENVGYQQWSPNAANASAQLNCGSLTTQGLTIANCSQLLQSICQFPMWDSYTRVGNFGYYKLHPEYIEWDDAKEVCRKEGTSMLVLRSQEEFDALLEVFGADVPSRFIHYGAHHKFTYYDFVTIYGEPLARAGYLAWAPNEPRNFATNHRVMSIGISARYPEKGFALSDETNLRPFICKRELYW